MEMEKKKKRTAVPPPPPPSALARRATPGVLREAWDATDWPMPDGPARIDARAIACACIIASLASDRVPQPDLVRRVLAMPERVHRAAVIVGQREGYECLLGDDGRALAIAPSLPEDLAGDVLARIRIEDAALVRVLGDPEIAAMVIHRCGLWASVMGDRLDADPEHGDLYACRIDGIRARMLLVTCPSTGLQHILPVPPDAGDTARAARLWTLRLSRPPDVES